MLDDKEFQLFFFKKAPLFILQQVYNEYLRENNKPELPITNLMQPITDKELLDFQHHTKDGWFNK
jgi:hypothetical protein